MTDALSLITSLGREGKSPLEIAKELHARGVKDARGRIITPAVVGGFLRFEDLPPDDKFAGAVWGKSSPAARGSVRYDATPEKKRKNKWTPSRLFSGEKAEEITRLYQVDLMKPGDIARKLSLPYRRVTMFCMHLGGFSVPPGEFSEFTDDQGRIITRCPPGYAFGAMPQRNVRPTQGGY